MPKKKWAKRRQNVISSTKSFPTATAQTPGTWEPSFPGKREGSLPPRGCPEQELKHPYEPTSYEDAQDLPSRPRCEFLGPPRFQLDACFAFPSLSLSLSPFPSLFSLPSRFFIPSESVITTPPQYSSRLTQCSLPFLAWVLVRVLISQ